MRRSTRTVPVAALLIAVANAQTNVVVNDPADTGSTTVYYSVCPTALTTTTTLSSTITICPGPNCNGGGPVITPPPNANGPAGTEILAYTTILPDGSVEEIHEYITIYPAICSSGSSIGQATYTITEACPCEATRNPASIPSGFTTTVTSCDVCHMGGPTTMTMTMPCTTGPYATQTPVIGPTGAAGAGAGANAEAAASSGANAEAEADTGAGGSGSSGTGSSNGSGSSDSSDTGSSGTGSNANANAAANANANAEAEASSSNTGAAGANSASSANSAAGANSAASGSNSAANAGANAGANAAANAEAGAAGANSGNKYNNGTSSSNNTISPPITPVAPGGASGAGANNAKFTGSADKVGFAVSGVLAIVVGCLAFIL